MGFEPMWRGVKSTDGYVENTVRHVRAYVSYCRLAETDDKGILQKIIVVLNDKLQHRQLTSYQSQI
jgi:hypothetical protein